MPVGVDAVPPDDGRSADRVGRPRSRRAFSRGHDRSPDWNLRDHATRRSVWPSSVRPVTPGHAGDARDGVGGTTVRGRDGALECRWPRRRRRDRRCDRRRPAARCDRRRRAAATRGDQGRLARRSDPMRGCPSRGSTTSTSCSWRTTPCARASKPAARSRRRWRRPGHARWRTRLQGRHPSMGRRSACRDPHRPADMGGGRLLGRHPVRPQRPEGVRAPGMADHGPRVLRARQRPGGPGRPFPPRVRRPRAGRPAMADIGPLDHQPPRHGHAGDVPAV